MSTSPPYKCPTCQATSTSMNTRNLVVFIDGTSNEPGDHNTSVLKLYDQVEREPRGSGPKQLRMYYRGIGTHEKNLHPLDLAMKVFYGWLEMAFAWNVEKNVINAYTWLAENYHEGDRIYLFGFSRGAYQVRALASMIHEVGLIKEKSQINMAYDQYLSIHPYQHDTRNEATEFKKKFCWKDVRIHFVGVWDTVSSIGLVKKDVFVSASAAVTNSCHFRHALALDERRVKFMPEYFLEVNAHRSNIRTRITAESDVKEVWFAGSHSDVGGTTRPDPNGIIPTDDGDRLHDIHAGVVPLQWMRREAAAQGLVFNSNQHVFWDPDDVDYGRKDTMTVGWRVCEILPFRHQVSFSGSGRHAHRWHLFRPRRVIPLQTIHDSVLSRDVYTPRATLGDGIDIPTARAPYDGLWTAWLPDESETMDFLTSMLKDPRTAQQSFEKVIFLLDSRLSNGQTSIIPRSEWSEAAIRGNFALIVIYYVASNFSIPEVLVQNASQSLADTLSSPMDEQGSYREYLLALRFLARHETPRHLVSSDMIRAAVHALEWTAQRPREILFPLIIDSLCYLIQDDNLRDSVINELISTLDGSETGKTRLSLTLEAKASSHLMAALKIIEFVAHYQSGRGHAFHAACEMLKTRIGELTVEEKDSVGAAAVTALVALNTIPPQNARFSNILGYLDNTLPRLQVDGGSSSLSNGNSSLLTVLRVNGSGGLDEKIMHRLVSTIKSNNTHERTIGTLALLKLCGNSEIRAFISANNVVDTLMGLLERKETALLAAYALDTCLKHGIPVVFPRVARHIFAMFNKGWFDDALGRVEGLKIFEELMKYDDLRREVLSLGIQDSLVKKLENRDLNEVRMSLICLNSLGADDPTFMKKLVDQCLNYLENGNQMIQKKGVKLLAALAKTENGQRAIEPRVKDIVRMLPPHSQRPRSQLFGPVAALYDISKNETLREQIKSSPEFTTFSRQRRQRATTLTR